jgi:hypothetical protein
LFCRRLHRPSQRVPVATFVFCLTVAALTYEEARSCALEAAQEHVRGLGKLGMTAYFHLAYLPQ